MTPTQFITACYRMASYYGITLPDTMTEGDAVRAMHYAGVDHPGDATAMVAPRLWDAETIGDAPEGEYIPLWDGLSPGEARNDWDIIPNYDRALTFMVYPKSILIPNMTAPGAMISKAYGPLSLPQPPTVSGAVQKEGE